MIKHFASALARYARWLHKVAESLNPHRAEFIPLRMEPARKEPAE